MGLISSVVYTKRLKSKICSSMEKIFLKPTPKEILIRGSQKEGHLDIFSYDYNSDEAKRKLGNLYIIGNVQHNDGDFTDRNYEEKTGESDSTYATNLVASLAKREYYSNPDLSPKEAFSAALKKINDVVDEFFVNKDVKINIGIFALAGENINISRIGKFKILLARDNKTIDILNNIDIFSKEKVQEKEFSHVVSGRIAHGDKILAFYPGRSVTAREKAIKESFLRLDTEQFLEKIDALKEEKAGLAYAALYINLNRVKEPAIVPKAAKILPPRAAVSEVAEKEPVKQGDKRPEYVIPEPELPRIIRSEFSLGKKDNSFAVVLGKIKMLLPKRQNKAVIFVSLGVMVLVGAWAVKVFFFVSPNQRQTANAVSEAQNNMKLAKTKISQNDSLGARKLLFGSIVSISSVAPSDKINDAKNEIIKLLDDMDKPVVESSPTLTEILPKSVSDKASLLAAEKTKTGAISLDIYEDNLYFIAVDGISKIADVSNKPKDAVGWLKGGVLPPEPLLLAVDGKVYVLNKSGLLTVYYKGEKQNEINTLILPDESSVLATTKDSQYLYLINKNMGRIYLISKAGGTLFKTFKVSSQEAFAEAYLDQDEAVYLVSKDNKIWKVQ
ncbi:MAG: hypothetical protein A3G51_01360 [Candidatus Yanofskybacteria bacterium RIFCSPLOWO2_12_FULL_43_11b]|uniref:Uncharacterized protein n=1 Tax=Candidatus Yanofskybacteria bacterium RIFCSPLOWO2_12_FULL_43_11b TaxID=1802710 RepID=A0A1F8H8B0_9BACT|nr:MAG: hypothetical protein A2742_01505 [Candidatus Yanofskybacteria bacterium RIFCSPHIGHO2_01_FULL_43_32]OGN12010.1 MAG: hypothetical protein A3C69_03040 [Candidatus Yanofskybacteria bacterium RIFCSPHIGHO2_02_FULL_43_12]OGN17838.1 MAG: hypothetical protein A3E34_01240 [Candidatus Yanofskybacteria bacterium RIFCSPHIGHO2_12_FULL_43_11]OGN24796.1 MAG: hypothetical protein A2923_03195 [Candidatus Yanofskybacteria bacterium RIFCSPLOWO2_01_FULL_43_46]OGN33420.1 MAG: hypothetical protein A3G51_01360